MTLNRNAPGATRAELKREDPAFVRIADAAGTNASPAARTVLSAENVPLGLSMALGACLIGFAVEVTHGLYDPGALLLLTAAITVCILGAVTVRIPAVPSVAPWAATTVIGLLIVTEVIAILLHNEVYVGIRNGTAILGILALAQGFNLRRWRWPIIAIMMVAFTVVASRAFWLNWRDPQIDVFMFQQMAAEALLHRQNPYALRFPNLYPYGTPWYGHDIVDRSNHLLFGFPYPPLSLLLVIPGYVIGGDCRFMDVLAVAATAVLMMAARPGRWGGLVASLFLLTPRVFFVIERSWTEPLLALTFSLVMFCALRWRPGLPYALGLFFATKQYTLLAVPLIWLLMDGRDRWRQFGAMLIKALAVTMVITLPFLLWNPVEFLRAVVQFQFLQPFRADSLSYLAWFRIHSPRFHVRLWTPLVGVVPTIGFMIWRCPRTPAGFAAGMTAVFLMFFAFSKQAFCNYYYFEIATACWAAVAVGVPRLNGHPLDH